MTVTYKDLKNKKNQLGQFMTPDTISSNMVSGTEYTGLIIEPSFGKGSFLTKLNQKYDSVLGVELDSHLYHSYTGPSRTFNTSFYQFVIPDSLIYDHITFVGNPPYRTPAFSLKGGDSIEIKKLVKKYKLTGIKEEAVFFIAKAVDLIREKGLPGTIHFVLPKTIFENRSAAFTNFRKFLNTYAPVTGITNIHEKYPDVAQSLCVVKFLVNQPVLVNLTNSLEINDSITFQHIFKKTYLGSIPCEGLLMSGKNESLKDFKNRLEQIFQHDLDIKQGLLIDNKYHLRSLSGPNAEEKFKILNGYVTEIKQTFAVAEFSDETNYKTITHRTDTRWYFRHTRLTKVSFIYILNSNPTKSFYFPGNPTKSSTDYFGFCDYDCNRNCSPGANRTVPVSDVIDNITDSFLVFWKNNTSEPIESLFDYILHVVNSSWYSEYKGKYQRFYFGLPKKFDISWRPSSAIVDGKEWSYSADTINANPLFDFEN